MCRVEAGPVSLVAYRRKAAVAVKQGASPPSPNPDAPRCAGSQARPAALQGIRCLVEPCSCNAGTASRVSAPMDQGPRRSEFPFPRPGCTAPLLDQDARRTPQIAIGQPTAVPLLDVSRFPIHRRHRTPGHFAIVIHASRRLVWTLGASTPGVKGPFLAIVRPASTDAPFWNGRNDGIASHDGNVGAWVISTSLPP
ncbi:hypothetical protein VFPBJ_05365 [Purpureocillium lilacinum]|uniref:Uncharacterized protein n=1 Tax=Purpureocillium lilacinum TaxID=33203 RepID=A0A179GR08_PURLI|nr:hypothetical protein VFPBJ_05365 [Purpureocillium lilacinum]